MTSLRIESFVPAWAARISEIIVRDLFEVNVKDYGLPLVEEYSKNFTPEGILRLSGEREIFAAFDETGEMVGTGGLSTTGNSGEANILSVFILPECQGRGLGRELVGFLETRAREQGFTRLTLSASETAGAFYDKLGYTDCHRPRLQNELGGYDMYKLL